MTARPRRRRAVELDAAQHQRNVKYGRRWQDISNRVLRVGRVALPDQVPRCVHGPRDGGGSRRSHAPRMGDVMVWNVMEGPAMHNHRCPEHGQVMQAPNRPRSCAAGAVGSLCLTRSRRNARAPSFDRCPLPNTVAVSSGSPLRRCPGRPRFGHARSPLVLYLSRRRASGQRIEQPANNATSLAPIKERFASSSARKLAKFALARCRH